MSLKYGNPSGTGGRRPGSGPKPNPVKRLAKDFATPEKV